MHKKKAYMARNCGISSSCRLWRQRRQQLPDTNSHSDKRLFLSSLPNHHRSSLGRSPPKRIDTCFYSKLEVNLGRIEIVAASTTIKIQMTQDICGGGIGRVVSWQASAIFRDFSAFFSPCFPKQKYNISPIRYFVYILHVIAVWCCNILRQLQLHEREAEHEHEAALLSALVARCERVDQLTMFN